MPNIRNVITGLMAYFLLFSSHASGDQVNPKKSFTEELSQTYTQEFDKELRRRTRSLDYIPEMDLAERVNEEHAFGNEHMTYPDFSPLTLEEREKASRFIRDTAKEAGEETLDSLEEVK